MASNAEWSLGDHIEMGDGATPTEGFDRVPEVRNITFNRGTRTRADVSSHDSTPPFRDNVPTFFEGGQITIEGNYLPHDTIQRAMEDKAESDTATNFKIIVEADAGNVTWSGQAFVTSFTPTLNFEDARRFSATLDLTGAWPRT